MSAAALQQRCWNHELREAACRCPGCGKSFCRECVSEHESRLLCAACLRSFSRARDGIDSKKRFRAGPVVIALAGFLISWVVFFAAGESILTLAVRAEQSAWQNR